MRLAPFALLASLPLLAAAPARSADELRVVYPAGWKVVSEEREWSTTETKEVSMKIDGEDASDEMLEGLKASMPAEREDKVVRFTTWLDAVEDGRPVAARRRFDELGRAAKKGDEESEEEGKLVGRTLLLTGSDPGGAVAARLAEDDEGPALDEAYLANHRLSFELELYLPEEAVDVGDTWDLPEAAVREILSIDEDEPAYFESDASGEGDALKAVLREAIELTGSVEYERREDVDGVACAVLVITLRGEAAATGVDPELLDIEELQGMKTSARLSTWMEGEERLWFALEAGRPVRSSAEWKGEFSVDVAMSRPSPPLEIAIEATADLRGGFEQSWTFEEER